MSEQILFTTMILIIPSDDYNHQLLFVMNVFFCYICSLPKEHYFTETMFDGNLNIIKVAFDATSEGILLTDDKAQIVFINDAVESILGFSQSELMGQNLSILFPEKLQITQSNKKVDYFNNLSETSFDKSREIIGKHKDGQLVPLELKMYYFTYNGEKFGQAIITDITKKKEKEMKDTIEKLALKEKVEGSTKELERLVRQLQETNHHLEKEIQEKNKARQQVRKALIAERELGQLKSRFLSLASHEFRTPLSGILTSASLLDKYIPAKNEQVSKHLNIIKSMVNHLGNILDDFLTLDRLNSGKVQYQYNLFSFNDLMDVIINECKPILKKGQHIYYTMCETCPDLYQDKKMVHIILINLLFNAIKYSPEDAPIIVDVNVGDEMISVKVTDKGIGIPAAEQEKIFSRFYRASNAKHLQGTGIGLNIVQANVKGLGGSISFTSKEGKGSSFIVDLPIDMRQ